MPKTLADDPVTRRRWLPLWLGVITVAAWASLLVGLDLRDATSHMERVTVLTSQDTFLRMHGWGNRPAEPDAWVIPSINDEPRLNKPPLAVWLNLLVWRDLNPADHDTPLLMYRARLVTWLLSGLLLLGTFWLARSLGFGRWAVVPPLIAATTLFFGRYARLAGFDTYLATWATLGCASGVWAIAPLRRRRSTGRRAMGWIGAAVFLGLAILSKGPIALLFIPLPLALAVLMLSRRKAAHLAALAAAAVGGIALALPWYVNLYAQHPEAIDSWAIEYSGPGHANQPWFYPIMVPVWCLPWLVWLIAGLVLPWSQRAPGRRRIRGLAPLVAVLIIVILSTASGQTIRYVLPLIGWLSLVCGHLAMEQLKKHEAATLDTRDRRVREPHWLLQIGLAAGLGCVAAIMLIAPGIDWLHEVRETQAPWGLIAGAALVLLVIAGGGWAAHRRGRLPGALLATAVFGLVIVWVALLIGTAPPERLLPGRPAAERVEQIIGDRPLVFLKTEQQLEPDEKFLLHVRRVASPIMHDELTTVEEGAYLLAPPTDDARALLRENGYELEVAEPLSDGAGGMWQLWSKARTNRTGAERRSG